MVADVGQPRGHNPGVVTDPDQCDHAGRDPVESMDPLPEHPGHIVDRGSGRHTRRTGRRGDGVVLTGPIRRVGARARHARDTDAAATPPAPARDPVHRAPIRASSRRAEPRATSSPEQTPGSLGSVVPFASSGQTTIQQTGGEARPT